MTGVQTCALPILESSVTGLTVVVYVESSVTGLTLVVCIENSVAKCWPLWCM